MTLCDSLSRAKKAITKLKLALTKLGFNFYETTWPVAIVHFRKFLHLSGMFYALSRSLNLKLPSLFTAWRFWTFHTKSHNMKALVILSHWWSPFLPLTCLYGKMNFCGSLCGLLDYFLEKKLLPDYPCKSHDSHDHDHQWADFVMAWLP